MRAKFSRRETRELRSIFARISEENPVAAQEVLGRILAIADMLVDHPNMGRKISSHRRRLPVNRYPYLIYYEVIGKMVRIQSVRHAARYRRAFQEPDRAFMR